MRKTRKKIPPILHELKDELRTFYGPRLHSLVLFGSHARGEATPESDMDVLVVLERVRNSSQEAGQLVPLLAKLNLKYGILPACLPIDLAEYEKGGTPLLRNVQREGVLIHG
jgi:predicted nucleotidyltransferase